MSCIIAADTHLQKKPGMWSSRSEIAGDDLFGFSQVVQIAKDKQADLMLLGDIVDCHLNTSRPISFLKKSLKGFEGSVSYIQGQHDIVSQSFYENDPWLSLIDNTTHIANTAFDFFGKKAYAMDFFPAGLEDLCFNSIPEGTQVLFLHGTIDKAAGYGFHFKSEAVPLTVETIFSGDWHKHQHLEIKRATGILDVFYCGSTYLGSSDEPLDKYVYHVDSVDGQLVVKSIKLKTRPIYRLSEMSDQDPAILVRYEEALPEALRRPLILVDRPVDAPELEKLSGLGHIYTTSGASPEVDLSGDKDISVDEDRDDEILSCYIDRVKYPEQFAFVLDVISSPVSEAITRLKGKLGFVSADVKAEEAMSVPASQDELDDINLNGDSADV